MPLYVPALEWQMQTYQVALPLLSIGATDFPVTWPADFGNATYTVPKPGFEGGTLVVGLLDAVVKPGTRTGTGCTVTVKNTGLVSIAAGVVLHVMAVG